MAPDGFYYFVYKTTNLINGKIYIGVHKTKKLEDGYIGCGIKKGTDLSIKTKSYSAFPKAVLKYGYDNFKREIIAFFDDYASALDLEKKLVTTDFLKRKDVYNCQTGGLGGTFNEEIRKKLSDNLTLNNPMKNREVALKVGLTKKGSKHSDKTRELISEKAKVYCNSSEVRLKRSIAVSGKNNKFYDHTFRVFKNTKGCIFVGTRYDLMKENKIKNDNFWYLLSGKMKHFKGWKLIKTVEVNDNPKDNSLNVSTGRHATAKD